MNDLIEFLRTKLDHQERLSRDQSWYRWKVLDMRADIESKRRIIALAEKTREWTDGSAGATAGYAAVIAADVLRALAAPFADDPGFRSEWLDG